MSKKALIVEDDPASNKFLQITLAKKGYDIVSSSNGAEGLYHYLKSPEEFEIILLDIMMPEVGGMEFVRVVESLYHRKVLGFNPRIIVETAVKNMEQLKFLTDNMTIHTVLQKPINLDDLDRSIESIVKSKEHD